MFPDKFCENCGYKLSREDSFCPRCGTQSKKTKRRLCKLCGVELAIDQIYCGQCGTRYEETADESLAVENDKDTLESENLSEDELTQIIEMDEGFQSALANVGHKSETVDEKSEPESNSTNGSIAKSLNVLIGILLLLFGLAGTVYTQTTIEKEFWYTYEPPYTNHEQFILLILFFSITLIVVGLIVVIFSLCKPSKSSK